MTSALFVKPQPTSWNDISRVAAIEALVEHGTWVIDDSPWMNQTMDKVMIGGRFYSDKMPLLSFMGAGVYAALYAAGMSLAPDCAGTVGGCAYYPLTLILMTLPAAILMELFLSFLLRYTRLWAAVAATVALAAATMVTPYAMVLNHHLPGAVALFASFYIVTDDKKRSPSWLVLAGALAAFAPACDGSSGIIAAGVAVIALIRYRRAFLPFALGFAIPVIATMLIDLQMVGTILPPYMVPGGYDYPGAAAASSLAGLARADELYAYNFRMFVGAQGIFAYNPLLLFAIVGAGLVATRRGHPLRIAALATLGSVILLCIYLGLSTGNYGGPSYGIRFFVPAVPILFAFIVFVIPSAGIRRTSSLVLIMAPLLLLSIFSTYQGMRRPWLYTPPPVHLQRLDAPPFVGIKWEVKWW